MAIVTPSTDLILLKCPLEVDQQNQMTFSSYSAQETYFRSLPKIEVTDFTYQRKDGTIRFPAVFEDIRNYNYCMYKNVAYGNKWFYCFIENMRYANDNVTEIKIKTDVFQTWQLSLTYHDSFIEREHVTNDSIGAHTLDEGLPTGEYIINSFVNKTICAPDVNGCYIALSVTEVPTKNSDGKPVITTTSARYYNGIIQGCYLILFNYDANGMGSLSRFIRWYDQKGKANAINALYALPKTIYPASAMSSFTIADPFTADIYLLTSRTGATDMGTTNLSINTNLHGYTPHNNKLFCYPYNYIMATNNNGTSNAYHWEDFSTPSSVTFKYNGAVTEGSSVKCYPVNYKKNNTSMSGYSFGIDMQQTPTFSWTNDMYLNWKAQNSFQGQYNQAGVLSNTFAQAAGSNPPRGEGALAWMGSMAEQGMNYLGSTLNAVKNAVTGSSYKASITPDQVNGEATGDLNYSIGRCGFTFYRMSIRSEMAMIIDNYFDMFGYKVSRVKNVNIHTRRYWNYIKCIQVNITGNIPQEDMNEIKSLFNNGITFWHDPTKYLDYSQTNSIL